MQPARSIFKIPVFITFLFFIGGFVAYRAGALDELFSAKNKLINPAAPEAKEMKLVNISNTSFHDTLPQSMPDLRFVTVSSSKSMMVIEPSYKLSDSLLLKLKIRISDSPLKKNIIMGSSKSATIFEPKPVWPYKIDSSKKKQ